MSDKKKTLQEALAEVQRNAELKRIQETKAMWEGQHDDVHEEVETLDEISKQLLQKYIHKATRETPFSRVKGIDLAMDKILSGRGVRSKIPATNAPKTGFDKAQKIPDDEFAKMKSNKTTGPETIDVKANKPSTGKTLSNLAGFALGAGAGTIVGDRLANKLKGDTSTASDTTPSSEPTSVTPTKIQDAPKQTFGQAFAAARKAAAEKGAKSTGQFEYQGKKFQTNVKGEKYVPMAKQTKVDIGTKVSEPSSTKPETPETPPMQPTKQSSGDSYVNREPGWRDTPPQPAPTSPKQGFSGSVKDTTPIGPSPDKFTKPQTESGGKKKMSESNSLIGAFLKLQETKAGNMFEAAKKMKKLDPVGKEDDDVDNDGKVDSTDKYLKHRREVIAKNIKEGSAIGPKGSENVGPAVTSSPKGYVDPSTPTKPYQKAPMSTKAGEIISKAKGAAGMKEEFTVEEFIEYHLEEGYDIIDIINYLDENYQLDEISKELAGRYIRKAQKQMPKLVNKYHETRLKHGSFSKEHDKASRKMNVRDVGLTKAYAKKYGPDEFDSVARVPATEETVEEGIADVVKTGAQVAKNFAANVGKGYAGSTGNVTRNITPVTTKTATRPVGSTFAKPGGASKAGEAVGSAAKAVANKPIPVTLGAGALAGAATLGANTPKFTKPDTTSAAPAPAPAPKPAAPSANVPLPPKRPLEVGKTFGQTFSAARQKAGGAAGEFEYKGKSYSTRMKGEKPVAPLKKVEEEIINEIGISKALQKKGYAIHGVGKHDNEFEVMRYNKDGTAKELSGYETDLRKAKHVANRDDNQEKKKNKKVQEEVLFSEEELAHFNSVLETASVTPSDSGETLSNTVSDTSPRRTLTDSKKAK